MIRAGRVVSSRLANLPNLRLSGWVGITALGVRLPLHLSNIGLLGHEDPTPRCSSRKILLHETHVAKIEGWVGLKFSRRSQTGVRERTRPTVRTACSSHPQGRKHESSRTWFRFRSPNCAYEGSLADKTRVPYFGVLIIRILVFSVLY